MNLLKWKLIFFIIHLRDAAYFSTFVSVTFLPFDYGSLLFVNAPDQYLKRLDIVYCQAVGFIASFGNCLQSISVGSLINGPPGGIFLLAGFYI